MFQLPPKSRTITKLEPAAQWGWNEILANKANYLLEILAWQNTEDAGKKNPRRKPEPFVPDFIQRATKEVKKKNKPTAKDIDEIKDILAQPRKVVK